MGLDSKTHWYTGDRSRSPASQVCVPVVFNMNHAILPALFCSCYYRSAPWCTPGGGLHVKAIPSIRTAHRALCLMPSTRAVKAVERLHSISLVYHHDQPRTKDPLSLGRHAVREDTVRDDVASHPTSSFRAWTGPRRGR
jgi:hypothetical protein